MQFVWFMVELAWKILLIGFSIWLFRWILGDGRKILKDLFKTIGTGIRAGCVLLQVKLSQSTKKEEPTDSIVVDGTGARYITQEEFEDMMREKKSFKLD